MSLNNKFNFFFSSQGSQNNGSAYINSLNPLFWLDSTYGLTETSTQMIWQGRNNTITVANTSSVKPGIDVLSGTNIPAVTFAGNSLMFSQETIASAFSGTNSHTLYFVGRPRTNVVGTRCYFSVGSSGSNVFAYNGFSSGQGIYRRLSDSGGATNFLGIAYVSTNSYVEACVYNAAATNVYKNGSISMTGSNSRSIVADRISIGGRNINGPEDLLWLGEIAEVIAFSGTHDELTRRNVERDISAKYNFPLINGYNNYSSVNYLTASTSGTIESASGFWASTILRVDNTNVAGQPYYMFNSTNGSAGWAFYVDQNAGTINFFCCNGSGVATGAPTYTLQTSDIGRPIVATGVYDFTNNLVRLYIDGVEIGSGTAITGFTAYNTTTAIGKRAGDASRFGTITSVFGCAGGSGIPTLANIQSHYVNVKINRKMVSMVGSAATDRIWNLNNTTAPSDIQDEVTGLSANRMIVVGTTMSSSHVIETRW